LLGIKRKVELEKRKKNEAEQFAHQKDAGLKREPYIVFFAGWRFPEKDIVSAKNKIGVSGCKSH